MRDGGMVCLVYRACGKGGTSRNGETWESLSGLFRLSGLSGWSNQGRSVWSSSSVLLTSLVELEKPNKPKELDRPDRPERHPNDEAPYLATWLANSMATRIFSRLVASNSCP